MVRGKQAGMVRMDHPQTAHDAAEAVAEFVASQRERITEFLRRIYPVGASDEEIWERLGGAARWKQGTERARRVALMDDGIVKAGLVAVRGKYSTILWVWVPPADRVGQVEGEKPKRPNRLRDALNLVEIERDEARDRIDKALALMDEHTDCTRAQVRAILESA